MAHLIKLQQYPSRYENDIFYFQSQYASLKKKERIKIEEAFNNESFHEYQVNISQYEEYNTTVQEEEKGSVLSSFFQKFRRKEEVIVEEVEEQVDTEESPNYYVKAFFMTYSPTSAQELRKNYYDFLFQLQLKWATSLVGADQVYLDTWSRNKNLRQLLTKLPDNYFVMYRPVLYLRTAPIELEIIVLSPLATWCISLVIGENDSTFVGEKGNFWVNKSFRKESKVVNPMHALNRMEKIVKAIYEKKEIEMPIYKVLLTRNAYIDYPSPPDGVHLVDKRNVEEWYEALTKLSSPVKFKQIKAAEALLAQCRKMYKEHV